MAENSNITTDRKLDDIFNEGCVLLKDLEVTSLPFNSSEFQDKVKKCTELFENSTRLVSLIGMFSTNETFDEIPTEHLKYLQLPFYLGQLTTKNSKHDREEVLKVAEIYYKDFLKRCSDYEICSFNDNKQLTGTSGSENDSLRNLLQQANSRNSKIEQYRQKKLLEEQIHELEATIQNDKQIDDETKRGFYIKKIKMAIIDAKNEINSIQQELEILAFRKVNIQQKEQESCEDNAHDLPRPPSRHRHPHRTAPPKPEPLRPIIITKDAAQKAVFGMGYPSLPVMTVNEFYDERVREGVFPDAEKVEEMNRQMLHQTDNGEKEEVENAQREVAMENDDPQYLERQRAFDEYKDVVRRGDGNRHNRS